MIGSIRRWRKCCALRQRVELPSYDGGELLSDMVVASVPHAGRGGTAEPSPRPVSHKGGGRAELCRAPGWAISQAVSEGRGLAIPIYSSRPQP